ncbi:MAG TPA: branched-chain amino acid ABC transporter substrate-binding protein [Micromonosporaceae bacterium]
MRQGLARVIGGASILGLLATGAAACNSSNNNNNNNAGANCGYEIAFFGALTGSAANLGINIEQGAELAVDQYNDANGANCITIKKFDSQGDPAVAPGVANQLVQDPKILAIIGPAFSGESEAADPIFNEAKIPTISPSATRPSLSTHGWSVFHRAVANDDFQGPAAANYIKTVLNATKVYVADDQSAYGAGLADIVKQKLGSLVVGSDKTEADGKQPNNDFSGLVNKIVASNADAFFYGGYYKNAGLIRGQLTAAGWKGVQVGGDGVNDPGFAQAAGNAAAAGSIVTCPCSSPTAAGGTFNADYQAKWSTAAGVYSDVAFDAANIILNGIKAGNTTIDKMQTYINGVNYTGVANTYKFTATGELDPSLVKVWSFKVQPDGSVAADQNIPLS